MYSVLAYYFSKLFSEIPVLFVVYALLFALVYPACQLDYTYSYKYYYYGGVNVFLALCGASYAFFLGSLVDNPLMLTNLSTVNQL